ncbi:DUF1298 domain-containing protein [Halieaceae bacterium IMCC14734]|uniref:diacylglycerol O-acyltransferase n=1 Tax=Candidatus Litorirhabdus singularis TaxID=2518993 RepID=A0ABT3TIC0_9GAMM|nr:wax ester/triacylglycerol synthase domain-containing protein [Candidatus Litorirhabdus singularis]MCX2982014.1 DUF1298 domain-containing protein [Candidatus Litorirhabdus singularis]
MQSKQGWQDCGRLGHAGSGVITKNNAGVALMDKLGLFDQFFYKADQYQVISAVMGGASILEPAIAGDKLDADAIAGHLANRLGSIGLLRNCFIQDPLRLGTVHKMEDPDFDIWDHIFVETLPAPGEYPQLAQRLAELSAVPLTLSQMWRWTIIDGLAGGKLAVMCNIHHAVADGVGLVEALSSMYDAEPVTPEPLVTSVRDIVVPPGPMRLLGQALVESGERLLLKTPRFVLQNTGPILGAFGTGVRDFLESDRELAGPLMPDVKPTSLNISKYSDTRSVSWKTLSLPDIKLVARHFDVTVNDMGLFLYACAMESYFDSRGEQVDFDLWCGVPVSTRSDTSGTGGNQVTAGRLCLHNTISDPVARLQAIHNDALELKEFTRPRDPVVDVGELADLIFPIALDASLYLAGRFELLARFSDKMTLANALFSNVPGPRQPVYVANGLMSESIPMIPAVDILAVSGGITSVHKTITLGFHCDGAVVSDPDVFVTGLEQGLKALRVAAGLEQPVRKKTAVKSRVDRKLKPAAKNKTAARKKPAVKRKAVTSKKPLAKPKVAARKKPLREKSVANNSGAGS